MLKFVKAVVAWHLQGNNFYASRKESKTPKKLSVSNSKRVVKSTRPVVEYVASKLSEQHSFTNSLVQRSPHSSSKTVLQARPSTAKVSESKHKEVETTIYRVPQRTAAKGSNSLQNKFFNEQMKKRRGSAATLEVNEKQRSGSSGKSFSKMYDGTTTIFNQNSDISSCNLSVGEKPRPENQVTTINEVTENSHHQPRSIEYMGENQDLVNVNLSRKTSSHADEVIYNTQSVSVSLVARSFAEDASERPAEENSFRDIDDFEGQPEIYR